MRILVLAAGFAGALRRGTGGLFGVRRFAARPLVDLDHHGVHYQGFQWLIGQSIVLLQLDREDERLRREAGTSVDEVNDVLRFLVDDRAT